jgi:hypothetical protein
MYKALATFYFPLRPFLGAGIRAIREFSSRDARGCCTCGIIVGPFSSAGEEFWPEELLTLFALSVAATTLAVVVAWRLAHLIYQWVLNEITWRQEERKWTVLVQRKREWAREQARGREQELAPMQEFMGKKGRHFQCAEGIRIPHGADPRELGLDVIRLPATGKNFLHVYIRNAIAEQERNIEMSE